MFTINSYQMKTSFFLLLLCSMVTYAQDYEVTKVDSPIDWVNPLMGTDSKPSLSNGNVYPAIARPWGMNFWTPQTGKMGDGWAYQYTADKLRGFKQTHQPSPWMNDYGQFAIMPITGEIRFDENQRSSWFSHASEKVTPYYYKVYLADHDVTTEITPTSRAASFRFTFPESNDSHIIIDALDEGSHVQIIPEESKIIGYSTKNSGGVPDNFKNYFVIKFDKQFEVSHTFDGEKLSKSLKAENEHVGAVVSFKTKKGEKINLRVASSFISYDQAELNMKEIATDSFDTVKEKGRQEWNKELSRIKVEGGSPDEVKTFYTTLYRSLLFPRKFYEYNAQGDIIHYSPYNGKVLSGYMFTDTGFWDTFRALFPFLNLMYPQLNAKIQEGLVNTYKESGWLPEWASPGLRDVMVGNNSASVVADAFLKTEGKFQYDIDLLYEALLKGANNEGPLTAVGRAGANHYKELGYVPYDVGINESAARTLEYAYDDFAIYQLAKKLKRPKKEIQLYKQRSLNYKKLYDPNLKLMRGKNRNGEFVRDFNPFKWGDAFTEGNSWHYTWSVFHDPQGLINLMGGKEKFVSQLDKVFQLPPVFDESYYGTVIHEIREMQIANMGQYAHGNQPIQHMIYLYNYANEPWKAQYWVRETMDRMYQPSPDGYCGDEDNGQTSAWYVFSALGFYPVAPATDQYVLGTPLFKKVTLELENGNKLIINAENNSNTNKYIKHMKFNGEVYTKNYLKHTDISKGGIIDITMDNKPNKKRGIKDADLPYSLTNDVE